MMEPEVKDGKDCIKFTFSQDRVLYLTIDEMLELSRGVRLKELSLGDELSFDELRQLRREFRKEERNYLKHGRLVHLAKYSDEMWKQMNEDYFKEHGRYPKQKGNSYVKPSDPK